MLKRIGANAAFVGALAVAGCAPSSSETATEGSALAGPTPNLPSGDLSNGADNFYASNRVTVEKVSFKNQYGMAVSGNLFTPNGIDRGAAKPAIVVGHPMGAVKEQSANLYATKLAEQGFVTMSLDLSFWGGSAASRVTPWHPTSTPRTSVQRSTTCAPSRSSARNTLAPWGSAGAGASSSVPPRSTRASRRWPR